MSKICVALFDPSGCSRLTENDIVANADHSENNMDRKNTNIKQNGDVNMIVNTFRV